MLLFCLDGTHLITGSLDKTARMWSLEDGAMVREFKGHENYVNSVCTTLDGKHFITVSMDTTARMWSLEEDESSGCTIM